MTTSDLSAPHDTGLEQYSPHGPSGNRLAGRAELKYAIIALAEASRDIADDSHLLAIVAAASGRCTGTMTPFIRKIARHARLIKGNTISLGETALTTGYIRCSQAAAAAMIREIRDEPGEEIQGIHYPGGEPHQLLVTHREDLGLTERLFAALDELEIYPRNCKFSVCAPPWAELGWPDRHDDPAFRWMANIALQIDIPFGIRPQQIAEQIRCGDPQEGWDIRCSPSRRPDEN